MTRKTSFSRLENDVLPKFRDSMAQAESTADVRKFFVYTALELLNGALGKEDLDLVYEDIELAPGMTPGYVLSPRLEAHTAFRELLATSDLGAILQRFAQLAGNQFKHMGKNPEKTEAKMFHGTGGPGRA